MVISATSVHRLEFSLFELQSELQIQRSANAPAGLNP
jgi:hypothetical protein